MIVVRLDGLPRGKDRPRFSKATGTVYTPERTARFEDRLALAAQSAMAGRPLLDGALRLEVVVLLPVPKSWPKARKAAALAHELRPVSKPDFDNFAKVVDAFNFVVWTDDAQVADGGVRKFYSDRPGYFARIEAAPADRIPEWVQGEDLFG